MLQPLAKNKIDAFDAVAQFQFQILNQKPPVAQMKRDIQMNQLHIRPFMGDIFSLNMGNVQFIDALWSIVKIDEYIDTAASQLSRKQVGIFLDMIGHLRQNFQDTINHVDMRLPHLKARGIGEPPIAVEIFRAPARARKRVH